MKEDFFQSQFFRTSIKTLQGLQEALPKPSATLSTVQLLKNYHECGKVLAQLMQKTPHAKKQKLLKKVSKLLKKETRQLFYYQQFYQQFPKKLPQIPNLENLSWSHIRATLKLKTQEEILFYLQEAAKEAMPTRHLEISIRHDLYDLTRANSKAHPRGKITRDMSPTYTFIGRLVEVIDGDTIELIAEQGFYAQYRLRLRLHGINAPELHGLQAQLAQQAKDFVAKTLSHLDFFIIKTYKTDAFGRYVADLLYHPTWKDHKKIFEEGFFLNQQLLDEGLASLAVY